VAKLRGQVEAEWQIGVMEMWRELSSDASIWKASGDGPMGEWSADILSARIRWSAECEPPTVALAFVREQLRRVPDHLLATVYLGRLLAESGDEQQRAEGIVLLEDMLRRDALVALMASETLEARYARLGWRADVERVQTRVRHLREAMLRGFRERQQLRASDHFTPYVLSAPALAALQAACAAQENVTAAFLIRKRTEYLCEQPCVMLAVECTAPWYKFDTTAAASRTCSALVDQVAVPEAADLFVVPVERRSRLLRRLRSVSGSECYRRT
jgi:hypothetical protein